MECTTCNGGCTYWGKKRIGQVLGSVWGTNSCKTCDGKGKMDKYRECNDEDACDKARKGLLKHCYAVGKTGVRVAMDRCQFKQLKPGSYIYVTGSYSAHIPDPENESDSGYTMEISKPVSGDVSIKLPTGLKRSPVRFKGPKNYVLCEKYLSATQPDEKPTLQNLLDADAAWVIQYRRTIKERKRGVRCSECNGLGNINCACKGSGSAQWVAENKELRLLTALKNKAWDASRLRGSRRLWRDQLLEKGYYKDSYFSDISWTEIEDTD